LPNCIPQCRNADWRHDNDTAYQQARRTHSVSSPQAGLEGIDNPLVIVEEREGGIFLQPAAAIPVRDISRAQLARWISRDEAEMKAFTGKPRGNPKK
jgi:hypothetical protein